MNIFYMLTISKFIVYLKFKKNMNRKMRIFQNTETECCVQNARKQTHKTSEVRAYLSTLPTSNHE